MQRLYTRIINDVSDGNIYSIDQVKSYLINKESLILPSNLTDKLLSFYGFHLCETADISTYPKELVEYTHKSFGKIYKSADKWFVEVNYTLSNTLLNQGWIKIKARRNTILSETDWVESSEAVSVETRNRFLAYREVVRDVVRVAKYPNEVVFPSQPIITYIKKLEDKRELEGDARPKLSTAQIEDIKSYIPNINEAKDWLVFLKEWQLLKFTHDVEIVDNLIQSYTKQSLESILPKVIYPQPTKPTKPTGKPKKSNSNND